MMLWAWKRKQIIHRTGVFFLKRSCLFFYGLIIWQILLPHLHSTAESATEWKDSSVFVSRTGHFLMVQTLSCRAWAGTQKMRRELYWFGRTSKETGNHRQIVWGTRYYWCKMKYSLKIQPEPCLCWKGPKKSSGSNLPTAGRDTFH